MLRIFLTLVTALALSAPAMAGHHYGDGGFSNMDTNGDGVVSREEFGDPFARWDTNGDGVLEPGEWKMGHGVSSSHGKKKAGKLMAKGFGMTDTDGDGTVSISEFRRAYDSWDVDGNSLLTPEEWREQHGMGFMGRSFGLMDKNRDNRVSQAEYMAVVRAWDTNGDEVVDQSEWAAMHGGKGHGKKSGSKSFHGGKAMGTSWYPALEQVDRDGDGMLSREEYNTAVRGGGFELLDADKSGMLEAAEWESFRAAHMGHGKKKY